MGRDRSSGFPALRRKAPPGILCGGDSPYASFINPKIAMDLQGTIMEGKPFCILRYHYL